MNGRVSGRARSAYLRGLLTTKVTQMTWSGVEKATAAGLGFIGVVGALYGWLGVGTVVAALGGAVIFPMAALLLLSVVVLVTDLIRGFIRRLFGTREGPRPQAGPRGG
jgi:hypothetical protein